MKINDQNKNFLLGTVALIWLMIVFIGYLYAHKPFLPDELLGILTALWQTLIAILILSSAGGIGMLTCIRDWEVPPLSKALLTSAIGLGVLGCITLFLACTVGVPLPLWILLPALLILLRKKILLWWKSWKVETSILREVSPYATLLLLPIFSILICQYLEAIAPPIQFDALTYHLVLPKAYLQLGKFTYIPDNIFWGMPQLTEMLYLLAMSLGGAEAAVVLGFGIGVIAVLGLADFLKSISGENTGWVTATVMLAGTGFTSSLSSGYVEWISILFGTATLLTLFRWSEKKDMHSLLIGGVFTGFALSIKYTNGVLLLAAIIFISTFSFPKFSFLLIFKNLISFSGMAMLIFMPWLIKNLSATYNPFYPIIFPSGEMDATLLNFYQFKPSAQDWSRLLLLPWQATIFGVDGGNGYSSSIGPLLLGLSPLAWVNWHRKSLEQKNIIKVSSIVLLSGFLIWAIGSQFRGLLIQTRLYFIIFPAWAVLAGIGFMNVSELRTNPIRFGNLVGAMIVLAAIFNAFSTFSYSVMSNPVMTILKREDDYNYMKRHLGEYIDAMKEIESLPSSSKVIMLWETRSLLCIPKCDPDEIIGRWYNDWTNHQNAEQVILEWKEKGYTHVLIYMNGAEFVRKYDSNSPSEEYWQGLETLLSSLVKLEVPVNHYQLYQIP